MKPEMQNVAQTILTVALLLNVSCASDTGKARALLEQATELGRQDKTGEARKMLASIAGQYPGTQEAAEAQHLLTILPADPQEIPLSQESRRHELLVQVGRFALDCGRYPTEQEGFRVLLENLGLEGWKGPYLDARWREILGQFEYKLRDEKPEITVRR